MGKSNTALDAWSEKYREVHSKLKQTSRVLRMADAQHEVMSPEELGRKFPEMLEDPSVGSSDKVRLLKMMQELAKLADDKSAEHELAEFSIEDLYAALYKTAMEELLGNEEFFISVVHQACQQKPALWNRLMNDPPDMKTIEVTIKDAD